jgi:serine protease Do
MKRILCFFLPVVLLGIWPLQAHCGDFASERLLPLPQAEARETIQAWLKSNGFHPNLAGGNVYDDGGILLNSSSNETKWSIRLHPHSALATRVEARLQAEEEGGRFDALWGYVDAYLANRQGSAETGTRHIPAPVDSARRAAVCIQAERQGTTFKLSGFAIDHQGLIASTAHDLKLGQTVTVTLTNGVKTDGRVVRLDADLDLSLIQVPERFPTVVVLSDGRYLPLANDTLFACGCPEAAMQGVQSGSLYGPPRRVAGQLLWQVQMHIEPGSSGSPVFDEAGRLVAVVKGRYRGANHIGFLIPYGTLLEFLEKNLK